MKELALVGTNNSHPFIFAGLVNGGVREKFVANSPAWTHRLFPGHDWQGSYGADWRFTRAWSRDPAFAGKVAEATRVDRVTETLAEAARGAAGAFVCDMWGEYHRGQALAFLEQGKPVFVDKPLAESVADARVMIAAARENGTVLGTCSSLRYDPEVLRLRKRLSGELGRPLITTICCPCYQDLARYTVHGIELLLAVTGGQKTVSVRNCGTSQRRHLLLVDFIDGSCGVVHSWEGHAYSVTVAAENGQEVIRPGVEDTLKPMVAAVLESFVTKVPVVDYEEVLEVVRIIEAGAASRAQGGRPVETAAG